MALVLPSQRTDWSGKMKATGLAFAPGVAQFEDASQQATVVKKSEQQVWFPAKKYGWGWGAAVCLAGMARGYMFCVNVWHSGTGFTSGQALWPVANIRNSLGGCPDSYLLRERREAALALGKGLRACLKIARGAAAREVYPCSGL